MRKKQKSKKLRPSFLIYIQQDEKGHLWIQSDSVGPIGKAFELGCEILNNLVAAEAQNPTHLTVQPLMISSEFQ